jgi:hypothetical protein
LTETRPISSPRRTAGFVLLTVAPMVALVHVIGLLDPVGSKASDDGDPFGTPPPASESITALVVCAALVVLGLWLVRRKKTPTQVG